MAAKKAKAKKPVPPPSAKRRNPASMRLAVRVLLVLLLSATVIGLIAGLGQYFGGLIAAHDRFQFRVENIACDDPPTGDRKAFLTEVRYLGNLPETVSLVDPAAKENVRKAFARHPWVAEVRSITVEANATIRAELTFRIPVLAVFVSGETEPRIVDRFGTLLPVLAQRTALAELAGTQLPPTCSAGEPWNDPTIQRAAELAEIYKPRRIEKTEKNWRITGTDGKLAVIALQ